MVWYRNGSADDPSAKSGIAHFLEHLMFKGTERWPASEFSKIVAGFGGQENAFTSFDYTAYFQRVPKEHLRAMMDYEADRMTGLSFDETVAAPERDVVLEERRMRVDSDPSAQLGEEFSSALYAHHHLHYESCRQTDYYHHEYAQTSSHHDEFPVLSNIYLFFVPLWCYLKLLFWWNLTNAINYLYNVYASLLLSFDFLWS